jgi:glycosyltransferase involved in cell wall biosynthesis
MTITSDSFASSPQPAPHITVCVCTFKRATLLPQLVRHLEAQRTDGLFTYDVVIADNDGERSAESTVRQLASASPLGITYCAEPQQNISLARNRAIAHATGELLAFIDDDEVPVTDWLYQLFQIQLRYQVDGVLGPVLARFEHEPPQWVTKGRFFDRPRRPTGASVHWPEARTGNVLVTSDTVRGLEPPFRPEFGSGGEDMDFFRRLMANGRRFVWCDEAVAHEVVPPYRCTLGFLIRRALLRGSNFPKQQGHRGRNVVKSIIAVPCYTLALPILALLGQHLFVAYLVKLLDHTSRLLAVAGVPVMTQRET